MMRLAFASLALLLAANSALAREVVVKWAPMKNAVKYEIEIETNSKEGTLLKSTNENSWAGDLPNGFHSFRIRAFDKLKRAGVWSESKPLVVMPQAPKPLSPIGGKKITLYSEKAAFLMRWTPTEGASAYHLELRHAGQLVVERNVEGTELWLELPATAPAGEYTWRAVPVVSARTRTPSSLNGRSWKGESPATEEFLITRATLGKPVPVFPMGTVTSPGDRKLRLKWKAVEGAEAYEVRLSKVNDRSPASQTADAEKKFVTAEETFEVKVPKQGAFRWQVRALANIDSNKVAGSVGPVSTTDFKVDPNAKFIDGSGYVALSGLLAPFTYSVKSQLTGLQAGFKSTASTVRLSGEYFLSPQWGLAAAFSSSKFSLMNRSVSHTDFELAAKYRINLSGSRYGWVFIPKAGLEIRQYPEMRFGMDPVTHAPDFYVSNPSAAGATVGFDIRKQFTESISLGAKTSYFIPLAISADSPGGKLAGPANSRNFSAGLQGLYWLNQTWGIGLGAFLEWRSISYQTLEGTDNGGHVVPTGSQQEVYLDGSYVFGSLIYSFGR